MSCYKDVYKDFPSRCLRLWDRIDQMSAKDSEDLSVTTMLVIAAAGFAMPWEHLKQDGPKADGARWKSHPAFKSVSESDYAQALKTLKNEFSKPLVKSELSHSSGTQYWRMATCLELGRVREVGEYDEGEEFDLNETPVRELLKCLRNALAHNNVCAFGNGKIERLSFFSERVEYPNNKKTVVGWNVATTSIEGFRHFLRGWFDLIETPHLRLVLSEAMLSEPEREAA